MNEKNQQPNKHSIGLKLLVGIGILLNIMYLLGQTMAVINYDYAVSIGMQEPLSEITGVGVAFNKGFGFGDTVFYIPLFVVGIVGLIKRNKTGFYAMIGAMAITIYWPLVCLSSIIYARGSEGWSFTDYTSYTILLSSISLYGIIGFWYLIKNKEELEVN